MPRTYEEETDIQKAILYAQSLKKPIWTQITTLYNVPYKRLQARANSRGDRSQNGGHNKALSIEQKLTLIRIIDSMELSGIHYRLFMISSIANFLLRKAHDDPDTQPPTISKLWTTRFLTRKPVWKDARLPAPSHFLPVPVDTSLPLPHIFPDL
jgi:hypothetical protein